MRITQEADYALRISYLLAKDGGLMDAGSISKGVGVTDRFTVKILRKLTQSGIIKSQKGAQGGYRLAVPASEISLRRVLEIIDGPLAISRCLEDCYECTRVGDDKDSCFFHCIFAKLNTSLTERLEQVTLDQVIGDHADINQILSKI